jgi:A/G-specific adenine glycosylase
MLQQTPVARVLPVYQAWITRWPTPAALAADSPGDAVRMWDRLGYPRRALRLHAAATIMVDRFNGAVPASSAELLELPGVGSYTAAAVSAFAYGRREAVLDTNVRRVQARIVDGAEFERPGAPNRQEQSRALDLLPAGGVAAAETSVALMELGALVCTARSPRCTDCPVADLCSWRTAGQPKWSGAARRAQGYAGTDRQCRGRLLATLRASNDPVDRPTLEGAWADRAQRERALDTLVADGLVEPLGDRAYRLPAGS